MALLIKSGFSEQSAFGMDNATRAGFCIIFGEMEGAKWDWGAMNWEKPSA